MMDLGIGAAAGMASAAGTAVLHAPDPDDKKPEDWLCMIHKVLCDLQQVLEDQKETKLEKHVSYNWPTTLIGRQKVEYYGYAAVYVLVDIATTFTVTVSGMQNFTWSPTVGIYNRFRYPPGTQMYISSGGDGLVDILYTNDVSSN